METNEAIKTLKDHKICFEHDFGWNKQVLDALGTAIEALAADVVARECYDRLLAENDRLRKERPVRHGRWIKDGDEGPVYCSECGEEHEWEDYRASYCDCCGAVMDKDGDEE